MTQCEITDAGALLGADGRLLQPGWARRPHLDANLEQASHPVPRRWRIKRWDYYGIWTPELFASATLADLGYLGLAFVYVVDLATGEHVEQTRLRPFARGIDLPRSSERGSVNFADRVLRLSFETEAGRRRIHAEAPQFDHGRGLSIRVELACPVDHDSIVVATPMGGRCFYYNRKINCMPAEGVIRWGDRVVHASPRNSLGQLDWGRGVWPYRSHWIWASANGFQTNGRTIGLNLGAGFGDPSYGTENAFFIDGRLEKLGRVEIAFDRTDYRRPWHCTDDAGRLRVTLTPFTERVARTNAGAIYSEVHQVFGRYDGTLTTDDGAAIAIQGLPGFAEEHFARW